MRSSRVFSVLKSECGGVSTGKFSVSGVAEERGRLGDRGWAGVESENWGVFAKGIAFRTRRGIWDFF